MLSFNCLRKRPWRSAMAGTEPCYSPVTRDCVVVRARESSWIDPFGVSILHATPDNWITHIYRNPCLYYVRSVCGCVFCTFCVHSSKRVAERGRQGSPSDLPFLNTGRQREPSNARGYGALAPCSLQQAVSFLPSICWQVSTSRPRRIAHEDNEPIRRLMWWTLSCHRSTAGIFRYHDNFHGGKSTG